MLQFAAVVAGCSGALVYAMQLAPMFTGGTGGRDLGEWVVIGRHLSTIGWSHMYDLPPYADAPLVLWLYLPLGQLPHIAANALWAGLMVACALVAWWLAAPGEGLPRYAWLAAVIGSFPLAYTLARGQLSGLLLLVLVVAWRLLRAGRPIEAGVALALALQLKPTVSILCALALLLAGERRVFVSWLGASLAFLAVYLVVLGPSAPFQYVHTARMFLSATRGPALPLLGGPLTGYLLRVPVLAFAASGARRANAQRALAIGMFASLLLSPYGEPYDLLPTFLAAWILHREAGGRIAAAVFVPGIIVWAVFPGSWIAILLWELCALVVLVVAPTARREARAEVVTEGVFAAAPASTTA